jgi:hypothetical protein
MGELTLDMCGGVDDRVWAGLGELPHLTRLVVGSSTLLRGVGLGQLAALRDLDWHTDADPRMFEELRSVPLTHALFRPRLDDDALAHVAAWPALGWLTLHRGGYTDAGLRALARSRTLRSIHLTTDGAHTVDGLLAVLNAQALERLALDSRTTPDIVEACRRERGDVHVAWIGDDDTEDAHGGD